MHKYAIWIALVSFSVCAPLAAVLVSAPAHAQMRQYGDPYAGSFSSVKLHQDLSRPTYRPDFSATVYRYEPPQRSWTPNVQTSWSSRAAGDSGSTLAPAIVVEPIRFLVPFATPGDRRAPAPVAAPDMWDFYLGRSTGADPVRAVALAQQRAAAGDAQAMILLSLASYQGRGLPADAKQSFEWMAKAAAANDVTAQFFLGEMYQYGVGVAADETQSLNWMRKAADAGQPLAAVAAGLALAEGRPGVPADLPASARYFERAAGGGNAFGQYLYAICLLYGAGVAKDQAAAIPWLQKASDQGLSIAQQRLGEAYYFGDGVMVDYRRALALFEQAAARNEPTAFNMLGKYYGDGLAVPVDLRRSVEYFRKGAERGEPNAQLGLGSAYLLGEGVAQDDREATRLLNLSADGGNRFAQYLVGFGLLRGIGVPRDAHAGIRRLQQSAAAGFDLALNQLCDETTMTHGLVRMDSPDFTPTLEAGLAKNQPACLYVQAGRMYQGWLGPRDQKRAIEFLERSAEAGYYNAELDYGRNFLALVGQVDASYDADLIATAKFWIARAAEHGSAAAEQLMQERGWR